MYTIPRRLTHCILDGKRFEPGEEYVSCLDVDWRRCDYCLACWLTKAEPLSDRDGHFWKGSIPKKKEKKEPPIDHKALRLFKESGDAKIRFILALYLQRSNQLLQRTPILYEIPETGEVYHVEKVSLSLEESQKLMEQILLML